jgi:hypothetical protein
MCVSGDFGLYLDSWIGLISGGSGIRCRRQIVGECTAGDDGKSKVGGLLQAS